MPENAQKKSLRVALIGSTHTVMKYRDFLEHLLVGLTDQSIPVALICPVDGNIDSVILGATEVIKHPVFEVPLLGQLNKRLLVEKLTKFKPTILHCLCESKASLTRQLACQLDLPFILTVNSLRKRSRQFSSLSRHCAKIVVPAKSIEVNMLKAYPNLSRKIKHINIGAFAERTNSCFSNTSRLATIVIAYQFSKADEFENLFSAIRHLLIDGYELVVVIIGGGRAERQLWKYLAALNLLQTVTILPGNIPQRPVFKAGDIFIQPQPAVFFDSTLLEAMSVGIAVAGCKGGVDDLIIDNETSVVFNPEDELNVMRALQQLLGRREFARKIAKNAQDYVKKNHSVSRMISATLRLYNQIRE